MSHSERYKDTGRTSVFYDGAQYGIQQERERIVELLTEVKASWQKPTSFNYLSELDVLIDLIKGEQK